MKYLFGIEEYPKDCLSGYLENIKYGRCKLRNNWLYFTLVIRGLRGIGPSKQKSIEEFDAKLKRMGYGNTIILSRRGYLSMLFYDFGKEGAK
ncbi:unnamed protein product [marine sediment metagenome]|uniref:Uncharacterized protein n=1 Tax=marine sediment metagenome TaxID=412755 RepID=X1G7F0_9ZZZZ